MKAYATITPAGMISKVYKADPTKIKNQPASDVEIPEADYDAIQTHPYGAKGFQYNGNVIPIKWYAELDGSDNVIGIYCDRIFDGSDPGKTVPANVVMLSDAEYVDIASNPAGMHAYKRQGGAIIFSQPRRDQYLLNKQKRQMIKEASDVAMHEVIEAQAKSKAAPTLVKINTASSLGELEAINVVADVKGNP